jgi:hypothetical protein
MVLVGADHVAAVAMMLVRVSVAVLSVGVGMIAIAPLAVVALGLGGAPGEVEHEAVSLLDAEAGLGILALVVGLPTNFLGPVARVSEVIGKIPRQNCSSPPKLRRESH